jgi:recombination protein RecT
MTDTAVATTARQHPAVALRERLEAKRSELKAALPADISVDHFIRAFMTLVAINPDLLTCPFTPIYIALMRCCRDGHVPDGVEATLIPFKNNVTYVEGYQGMLRNFRRSGKFKWIDADVVREGDEFTYYKDETGAHMRHVPGEDSSRPVTRVYAIATTLDGGCFVSVLSMQEIQKIKNVSRNTRDDAPWKIWPDMMMRKTALRRLSKLLPTMRDLMKSDLDEHEAPDIAPRDEIAAIPAPPVTDTKSEVAGDEGGGGNGGNLTAPQPSQPAAARSPREIAWRRGQEAKAAGQERKSIPGEYRSRDRLEEGRAWQDGFDGKPLDDKGEAQLV